MFVTCLFCLSVGYFLGYVQLKTPTVGASTRGEEIRSSKGYTYTNPLLNCEVALDGDFKELFPFKNKIQDFVDARTEMHDISMASVYFRDLNNGPWFGINSDQQFNPASLLKVPILIGMLKREESTPGFLQNQFTYTSETQGLQENATHPQLKSGQKYSMDELLVQMITHSDNTVANMLSMYDKDAVMSVYNDLGIKLDTDDKSNDPQITVRQYGSLFRILFNASYLSRPLSEKALEMLVNTTFTSGIVAGVPSSVNIAHKYGERSWTDSAERQLHDCGIVYYPNKPYLLCVMTRGSNFTHLSEVIAAISKIVYTQVDSQLKK